MAVTLKEQQSELVKQHHRLGTGAWVNGSQLKEESKATMTEANSGHGNFEKVVIEKRNA